MRAWELEDLGGDEGAERSKRRQANVSIQVLEATHTQFFGG